MARTTDDDEFDPLDVMLAKARKRGVNPMFRIQAFTDTPVLKLGIVLTRGDLAFSTVAALIGAKGFALGLILGKWSLNLKLLRENLSPLVAQLYPVLLAIAFDLLI